jgi:hypothetical protein
MVSDFETPEQGQIWQAVRDLNDAWVSGNPERLVEFFHQSMIIAQPGFQQQVRGRRECVDSYRDFCARANVRDFRASDPSVDVFGQTAVVSYSFDIDYELDSERFSESGRDLFVFVREGDKWWAVWRTIVPTIK